ncbi:hypothetical protein IWW55_005349 [Coemansia sp. RSA 2706]|nr:hypothetical protein IWW55_005349 [Coemansia sp. RSA 2706]
MDSNPILQAFVTSVNLAFASNNGVALSKLFVFDDYPISTLANRIHASDDLDYYTADIADGMHAQITLKYLDYVRDRPTAQATSSHAQLCHIAELFTAQLTLASGPWLLPVMRSVARALCASAQRAHAATQDATAFTQSATRLLQLLIVLLGDSAPTASSKRQGALMVAALLLRISLRTNAAPGAYAGKALEAQGLQTDPAVPMRDRVSFSYWLGRYYLTCYYIEAARTQLDRAFAMCPPWHYHNKRVILRHLFVANLLRGRLPHPALLQKYDLEPAYYQLVKCFRHGNLARFQQTLADNMELFRSQGHFLLLLERSKLLIFRNVLRKVHLLNQNAERSNVLQYADVLAAFRLAAAAPDMDLLEMEAILASMISQKLVLGYLFHHQRLVNLSRKTAFPEIAHVGQTRPR